MADSFELRVNTAPVRIALGGFARRITSPMVGRVIGVHMLASVAQTFRDEGSPAGSWPPLSPATLARARGAKKKLIASGLLRNSVTFEVVPEGDLTRVRVGSNVAYARVHQEGFSGNVTVPAHQVRARAHRAKARDVFGKVDAGGGKLRRRKLVSGVGFAQAFTRGPFSMRMNIPARPFIVFRPEDPERIVAAVQGVLDEAAQAEGLK